MSWDYQTSVGDTGLDLVVTLKSDVSGTQTAVNFSTYTSVAFYMWPENSATFKVNGSAATFSDAANGEVTYTWAAGDVDTAGNYRFKFVAVDASGDDVTFPRAEPGYATAKIWAEAEIQV